MLRLDITIKNAVRVPLLGVKNQPSPYIIMKCEGVSYSTPIAKYSQNPIWNYHTIVESKKVTSFIHFFIYNNNPNAVDELLSYAKLEFGQLMTRTNSQYKLRLMNSLEQPINSFLFLEHYDANPADLYIPLGERTSIMLRLINQLPSDHYFTCQYGDSSFNLSQELNENAFRYNPKYDSIKCVLKGQVSSQIMETELLIGNIGFNSCINLRFNGNRQEFIIFLSTSIILNGLLPENYNILNTKINDVSKSNGKKSGYKIKLYGPLNENLMSQKAECELYVQNSSQILVEYFEDTEILDGFQPYCSFRIPINSLNWSNQKLQCNHQLKYYDSYKSTQTIISLCLAIKKTFEISKIIPKLNNTETLFDFDSTLLLEQLKLQNCYLFQVIKNNVVQLFHLDKRGIVTAFNKFTIVQNKIQYILTTREYLRQGGRGTLFLVNLDQQFQETQTKGIQKSLILKIVIQQPNKIEQSKIEYSRKFLAFAKKASVVNICKKFNQMVHDDLLKIKVKSRYTGTTKKGILRILNIKSSGSFGKINVLISVDSASKHSMGQIGNYLMQKSHIFYVNQGSVKIKVKLQGTGGDIKNKELNKGSEDNSICYYGSFCEFFGTPTNNNIYNQELKISSTHKIQIIYTFYQGEKLVEIPIKKLNQINFFNANDSISLKLKRAFVGFNNKQYKFRISRGSYAYESQSYNCGNNKIYFQSSQNLIFKTQNGESSNPIFISAYSHDEDNNLLIYNGFINCTDIVGKGEYQVMLVYEKEEKRQQILFIFEVLHSSPSLLQNSTTIKVSKISTNTSTQPFRNIYKHYLLAKVNNFQYDIYECTINEQFLTLNASINLRRDDFLIFELYSSYKAISKELFNTTEKELIACCSAIWQQIEQNGIFVLNYYPKKQGQLRFTRNSLTFQQRSYKMHLNYTTQKANLQSRIEGLKLKPSFTEIDVLNRGVCSLFVKQFYPLQLESKILSIQIKSLNLQISSQSSNKINRMCLLKAQNMEFQSQALIMMKQGQKYKRIIALAHVKLKGNHYKINQINSLIIKYENYFYLTANFMIFHNKFVSIPNGNLIVKQISARGVHIDRFQLAFLEYPQILGKQNQRIYKKQGSQAKECDISIKTTSQMNSFLFYFQGKGFKTKHLLCLSQMNIDRYEEQFVYERQILISGQSLIIALKLSYNCIKQVKQQGMSIKYALSNSSQVEVAYIPDIFNVLTADKTKSQNLAKTQGFFLQIIIPNELTLGNKELHLIYQNLDPIKLTPSASKNNRYAYYSNKYLEVKTMKFINRDYMDKPVEPLGKQQGVIKFMIDQNPKLICTMTQNPCSISNIGNENWTLRFNFHRLLALSKKRLLYLKNAPNDQILTKTLAILVKHGSQYKFIRNLDEFGNNKTLKKLTFQFGYDSSCNILEVFLVIDNYFNAKKYQSFQKLMKNWVQFFPISYGSINISNITPDLPFGFELLPLQNNSPNLEKAINQMVIRQQNIFCLCDVSFTKKAWGFLTIKLKGCTALNFVNKKEGEVFVYFRIQVEDSNRVPISTFNSEARPIGKIENLQFTNNTLSILLIQQNIDIHYSLKMTGFVLQNSNHYSFIEKRQDITDYFQKRGKQQINIQVKANETNNLCKNTFQINLELVNSIKELQKVNLIEKAKSINSVDALSFRQMDNIEFFERLLGCQQLSHFNQCLQQIKQSFIYVQNAQYSSFILLIQYLSFMFDAHLIGEICEIIHLNILKCPQIISDLQQAGITNTLYDYSKLICLRERRNVPSKATKVSNQQYLNSLAKFKQKKDFKTLKDTLNLQMYMLYTPQQLLSSLSTKNNEAVLNIINLLLKHSKVIKDRLSDEMKQWIQMFGFTPDKNQFQLFVLVLKNTILYGSELSQQNLHRFIEILLQKTFGLSMIYEFWQRLLDKTQQISIYESIIIKYQNELYNNSVETCRGLKMMLTDILNPKSHQIHQKMQKYHQNFIKILINNASKFTDIVFLSSHFDFLTYLFQQKLLNEATKAQVGNLIQTKMKNIKDNSAKLILNTFSMKFNQSKKTNKPINANKKQGLAQQMADKVGFYKKYLITSD